MIDHEEQIIEALKTIPGLGRISDAWPDAKTRLPCIVVGLASDKATDRRDDRKYLVELSYYVRLFAIGKPEMLAMLTEIDRRMEAIGYERTFRFEQSEPGAKQWVLRYTTTVSAENQ